MTKHLLLAFCVATITILLFSIGYVHRVELSNLSASVYATIRSTNSLLKMAQSELSVTYEASAVAVDNLIMVAEPDINGDGLKDFILQIRDDTVCGSAGCPYELFLQNLSTVERIKFGFSGDDLKVKNSRTSGYVDITLRGLTFKWDGQAYGLVDPEGL